MVDLIVWALAVYTAVCILTGYGLGSIGDSRAKRRAEQLAAELAEERGLRKRAESERALAVDALERATHPVQHTDDIDALVRATAPEPLTAPVDTGRHRRPLCGAHNPKDFGLPECELPAGHAGTHTGDGDEWEPSACRSLTSDPFAPESPELYCEHDLGDAHTGRHTAYEGDVEWDDEGETWIHGEQL